MPRNEDPPDYFVLRDQTPTEECGPHAVLIRRWLDRYDVALVRAGSRQDLLRREEQWDLVLSGVCA